MVQSHGEQSLQNHYVRQHSHITINALEPETTYEISVFGRIATSNNTLNRGVLQEQGLFSTIITTQSLKRSIDVSKAPYYAKGDGSTINTHAIQRALDDCDRNSWVVIPQGIFLTGALCMHSESELWLCDGAVLQGTDNPHDYEPRVLSRFEGIERECFASLLNYRVSKP